MGVFTAYFEAAMRHVVCERLPDGTWLAHIEPCPGVWATGPTPDAAVAEVREVLEEWVLLGLAAGDPLPAIEGHGLRVVAVPE